MISSQPVAGFRELLRDRGLRVTSPRIAVLSVIDEGMHVDAETVTERVRERLGSISTQTVYDVLAALTGAGILRRIEPAGSPARFERRVGDNHHHVVCRECGAIEDVECVVGAAPCMDPPAPHEPFGDRFGAGPVRPRQQSGPDGRRKSPPAGYLIDEVEVTFWGVCPLCRAARE